MRRVWVWFGLVVAAGAGVAGQIQITELMYHPASEDTREEYVELHNPGVEVVDLAGWRFTTGVRFEFPAVKVAPGGWLVVCADTNTFARLHPGVGPVVGNWAGILSRSGQLVELVDANGQRQDSVRYSDDGDWARRFRAVPDAGHRGLEWRSGADGKGFSLELINLGLPNKHGQNWAPSVVTNGTPGRANSVAQTNSAPLIVDVRHAPLVPRSVDPVTIVARLVDESTNGLVAWLHYRLDGASSFTVVPMRDDGKAGDAGVGDGIFTAVVPAATNHAVVEFFVEARDGSGLTRTWPAPVEQDGALMPVANALYQVDDTPDPGALPLYRLILTAADAAELHQINRNTPGAPYPTGDQTSSHAAFNGTFISRDGTGTSLHYTVEFRNRGNGSRSKSPQSFRVNFLKADRWKGVSAVNLNAQYPHSQLLGSALYRHAGLPTQSARAVQILLNGATLATAGSPSYGFHVCNEVLSSDFAAHLFPDDSSGNGYRGIRIDNQGGADLRYQGELPTPYRVNYFKETNTARDDWSDLIKLTRVLSQGTSAGYLDAVLQTIDLDEWMLYFALECVVDNKETNIANSNNGTGEGDDYYLYSGVNDPRMRIIPYDLDTILDLGDTRASVTDGLFRMDKVQALASLVHHPDVAPRYYRALRHVLDSTFAEAVFDPLISQVLTGLVPPAVMESTKAFAHARAAFVRSQIPTSVTVTNPLPLVSGFAHTTAATVALSGQADPVVTRRVVVNEVEAQWSAWEAQWKAPGVGLQPGLNRILIRALDGKGAEVGRATTEVWSERGSVRTVSGTVGGGTWSPAGGPYLLNGSVLVPAGATLSVEPGTTVYLQPGAALVVEGRLMANGVESAPIHFMRAPGVAGAWGNLLFRNGTNESRLVHALLDGGGAAGQTIRAVNTTVWLDHLSFTNTTAQYLTFEDSSFEVRNSVFPDTSGVELIHGLGLPASGHGVIRGNWFGGTTGLNDIIDFTGGQRPNAILEVYDNVFTSGSDDQLDLDGTDAHVEGNLFLHSHQTASTVDTSSAISGGKDGGNNSRITLVRNVFFDCDHIALAKEGNFYTLENNTAISLTKSGMTFDEPGRRVKDGVTPGLGAFWRGNILWNTATNFEDVYVNDPQWGTTRLSIESSILSGPGFLTNGPGNLNMDPRFVLTNVSGLTWQTLSSAVRLRPGSPALGTGPNGLDRGALVVPGASIYGEPSPVTFRTEATLTVGGPGITDYRFRINGGAYGGTNSVALPIQVSGLTNGSYVVEVLGRNSAGRWQDEASPCRSRVWTVETNHAAVVLNEILARNQSVAPHGDTFPDMIELYNDGPRVVDLSGWGLSDDVSRPGRFIFPAGTMLAAGGYLVVFADGDTSTPGLHAGFALGQAGETVQLSRPGAQGWATVDSVTFGPQLPDYSIGRAVDGRWLLCRPSFGAANVPAATGDPAGLRINEWLANTVVQPRPFVEIYNPDSLPVALEGLFLTDNPISRPRLHSIAPLTFVSAHGALAFTADGDSRAGADHLSFQLAPEDGLIALFDAAGNALDWVVYGPQSTDVSQGRSPSGSAAFSYFASPSPGGGNPGGAGASTNLTHQTLSLVPMTGVWRYDQSGSDLGTTWSRPDYDDSKWAAGAALLYVEPDALPAAKSTPLTLGRNTYYFRTRFVVPAGGLPPGSSVQATAIVDDGMVAYLNGSEILRLGMPSGPVTAATHASRTVNNAEEEGPIEIPLDALRPGTNVLAVEVHQVNATSSDVAFGMQLDASLPQTNLVAAISSLRIHEVLALSADGAPGWIELYNPSPLRLEIGGLSLSDDPGDPRKWQAAPGASIAGLSFLVLTCDAGRAASGTNTGWGLHRNGGSVLLFDRPEDGGGLLSRVDYGLQIPGFSVGDTGPAGLWSLCLPTPGSTNLAALLGDVRGLRINEWMADPASGEDWFEVYNPNPQPVALGGLYLTDDPNNRTQSGIAPLSFVGAGTNAYRVWTADGAPSKGAEHVGFKLSANGESIGLYLSDGTAVDLVQFGIQTKGVSEGRLPDGATNRVWFERSATPGSMNYLPGDLVINEVLAHTDPPLEDAIELFNPTAVDVPVGGWFLSNSPDDLKKFRLPDGSRVPAGGYLVLYENQFKGGVGSVVPFTFNSAHGDQAIFSAADSRGQLTGFQVRQDFGSSANGVSFGRYVTSQGPVFTAMRQRSFGMDAPSTLEQFRSGRGLANPGPLIGPVVVQEIMYHPAAPVGTAVVPGEFVALRNITGQTLPLFDPAAPTNTWSVDGGIQFRFPSGATLAAGGVLLLVAFDPATDASSEREFRLRYQVPAGVGIFGPFVGKLNNSGEAIELYKPDPPQTPPHPDAGYVPYILVDRVHYHSLAPWPVEADGGGRSLHRVQPYGYGNDPVQWIAAAVDAGRNGVDPDADGDGMPDAWEIAHGLNPLDASDAARDADGDGMSNRQEFLAGTDPRDPASRLMLEAVRSADGLVLLVFEARPGVAYAVETRAGAAEPWQDLQRIPAAAQGAMIQVRLTVVGSGHRFYRLRVVSP